MTKAQKDAMAYLDSIDANAVRFPSTGWIWRDDIRRREWIAEIVVRAIADRTPSVHPIQIQTDAGDVVDVPAPARS